MRITTGIAAVAGFVVVACTTSPAPQSTQSFCSVAKPIYLDSKDVLTRDTVTAILRINQAGEKLCGWKRP